MIESTGTRGYAGETAHLVAPQAADGAGARPLRRGRRSSDYCPDCGALLEVCEADCWRCSRHGDQYRGWHWIGIVCAVAYLALVGYAAVTVARALFRWLITP